MFFLNMELGVLDAIVVEGQYLWVLHATLNQYNLTFHWVPFIGYLYEADVKVPEHVNSLAARFKPI